MLLENRVESMKQYGPYVLNGKPVAWKRAVPSHSHSMWDSQKQDKFCVARDLALQHDASPLTEPLHLQIIFYLPIPQTARQLKNNDPHFFTPDLSNLLKFLEDAATGVLWNDDCIISSVTTKKVYSKEPRTELIIEVLEKGNHAINKKPKTFSKNETKKYFNED